MSFVSPARAQQLTAQLNQEDTTPQIVDAIPVQTPRPQPTRPRSQSIRTCSQCTATTRAGDRCRKRTCMGQKCWIHLKKDDGLRIKKSSIDDAGKGLYTLKPIAEGDTIAPYTGQRRTRRAVEKDYPGDQLAEYVYCTGNNMNRDKCIDSSRTNSGAARFANDSHGTDHTNNAEFVVRNRRVPTVDIVATDDIDAGSEIFVNYGPGYFPLQGSGYEHRDEFIKHSP